MRILRGYTGCLSMGVPCSTLCCFLSRLSLILHSISLHFHLLLDADADDVVAVVVVDAVVAVALVVADVVVP